jgi:hypothetical protein
LRLYSSLNHSANIMNTKPFLLTLAISLIGCGVKAPIEGRNDPHFPAQIHFASADLANRTAVSAPIMTRKNGGILYVTVPIRSAGDLDLHIDYRVTFFDEAGQPIGPPSGWTGGTTLESNVPSQIHFNSHTADAADFRLDRPWASPSRAPR